MFIKKGLAFLSVWTSVPGVSLYLTIRPNSDKVVFGFSGSSSMTPVMELVLRRYMDPRLKIDVNNETNIDPKIVISLSAIGSNNGLQHLIQGTTDFAMVSHSVHDLPKKDPSYAEHWKKRNLKTITVAKEAMFLLYKPPKKCEELGYDFVLNRENAVDLYSLFSGHHFFVKPQTNLKYFMKKVTKEPKKEIREIKVTEATEDCSAEIVPWVKNSGPIKSGTAKAFVDNPLLDNYCLFFEKNLETKFKERYKELWGEEMLNSEEWKKWRKRRVCERWLENVRSGWYGSLYDDRIKYVPESNSLHWDSFSQSLKDGSMTYLPSFFVFSNWDVIWKSGVRIAAIQHSDKKMPVKPTSDGSDFYTNKSRGYKWGRVFNLIYSDDKLEDPKKDLKTKILNHITTTLSSFSASNKYLMWSSLYTKDGKLRYSLDDGLRKYGEKSLLDTELVRLESCMGVDLL